MSSCKYLSHHFKSVHAATNPEPHKKKPSMPSLLNPNLSHTSTTPPTTITPSTTQALKRTHRSLGARRTSLPPLRMAIRNRDLPTSCPRNPRQRSENALLTQRRHHPSPTRRLRKGSSDPRRRRAHRWRLHPYPLPSRDHGVGTG